jgi:hypothetical protein
MTLIKTQIGTAASADFEEDTWSFLMNEGYQIRAGKFAIMDYPVYEKLINFLKGLSDTDEITDIIDYL